MTATGRIFDAAFQRTQRYLDQIDLDLSTGISGLMLNALGTFFYVDQSSTGRATIEPQNETVLSHVALLCTAGMLLENHPFTALRIDAPAQPGKTLRLIFGHEARVKSGDPAAPTSTISGECERVEQGICYCCPPAQAALAGNYSAVQLFNPAASGVNAFISKVWVATTDNTQSVIFRSHNTPLTTFIQSAFNKKIGSAVGKCEGRKDTLAALPGTNIIYVWQGFQQNQVIEFTEPLMLIPGSGIVIVPNAVNIGMFATFELFEEPI